MGVFYRGENYSDAAPLQAGAAVNMRTMRFRSIKGLLLEHSALNLNQVFQLVGWGSTSFLHPNAGHTSNGLRHLSGRSRFHSISSHQSWRSFRDFRVNNLRADDRQHRGQHISCPGFAVRGALCCGPSFAYATR